MDKKILVLEKLKGGEITLCGCGCKDGEEVDGWEFEVENLVELVEILGTYRSIHLNCIGDEDIDIWLEVEDFI